MAWENATLQRIWATNNREHLREYQRRWRLANLDKIKTYNQRRPKSSPKPKIYRPRPDLQGPRYAAQQAKLPTYYGHPCAHGHGTLRHTRSGRCIVCHRISIGQRKKRRFKERAPRLMFGLSRAGARRKGLPWELSLEKFTAIIEQPCHYCGAPPRNGVDRIDSSLGYTGANTLSCCTPCNRGKNTMPYDEYIAYLERLVRFRSTA